MSVLQLLLEASGPVSNTDRLQAMLLISLFFMRGTYTLSAFHNKVDKHTMEEP
jgi:hypothetical protein